MKASIYLFIVSLLWACANVTAPTGGPKDETPPKLISSVPKQGQTNYSGQSVLLEFDEYLKLKNAKEEIIITPAVKEPKFLIKKNTFQIDLGEKLLDSTTYSIAFRETIQDLNEGNPAEDLRLAFSTGSEIDSLRISGEVNQLLRGTPAEKYTVAVYTQDTFNIFKHKPVYFTRTNKEGRFYLNNLKANTYYIYAWEDKNKNLSLQSQTEKFGFLTNSFTLNNHIDSIKISTVGLDSRPLTVTGIRRLGHFTKLRFNKNVVQLKLKSLDSTDLVIPHAFAASQSEVDIFPNKPAGDSTLINVLAIDSLEQRLDTSFYIKQTDAKSLKEKIKAAISGVSVQTDIQRLTGRIDVSELIRKVEIDSFYIKYDTILKISLSKTDIKYDTLLKRIYFTKTFEIADSIDWKKSQFILGHGAIASLYGDSTKRIKSSISAVNSDDAATLIISFPKTKQNTIIQILNERFEILHQLPMNKTTTFKNVQAGSVFVRAIEDTNRNGVWDAGNANKRMMPEKIVYYFNDKKKKEIPLRANWEVNISWNY